MTAAGTVRARDGAPPDPPATLRLAPDRPRAGLMRQNGREILPHPPKTRKPRRPQARHPAARAPSGPAGSRDPCRTAIRPLSGSDLCGGLREPVPMIAQGSQDQRLQTCLAVLRTRAVLVPLSAEARGHCASDQAGNRPTDSKAPMLAQCSRLAWFYAQAIRQDRNRRCISSPKKVFTDPAICTPEPPPACPASESMPRQRQDRNRSCKYGNTRNATITQPIPLIHRRSVFRSAFSRRIPETSSFKAATSVFSAAMSARIPAMSAVTTLLATPVRKTLAIASACSELNPSRSQADASPPEYRKKRLSYLTLTLSNLTGKKFFDRSRRWTEARTQACARRARLRRKRRAMALNWNDPR